TRSASRGGGGKDLREPGLFPCFESEQSGRDRAPSGSLRCELSVGMSGDEQINVQSWIGGDSLRLFEVLMKNRENEFRLAPRAVCGADELAGAAGDHQSQLEWPGLKELEAWFEVRKPKALSELSSPRFVQFSDRAGLHSHSREHFGDGLCLSLLLRDFGLPKLRRSKQGVAGIKIEDRPRRAPRFNDLKRSPIDAP